MNQSDAVEFYLEGKQNPFCIVDSHFQPEAGDLVSIKGETWEVAGRSFSVDYSGKPEARMRCNVIVRAAAGLAAREAAK